MWFEKDLQNFTTPIFQSVLCSPSQWIVYSSYTETHTATNSCNMRRELETPQPPFHKELSRVQFQAQYLFTIIVLISNLNSI